MKTFLFFSLIIFLFTACKQAPQNQKSLDHVYHHQNKPVGELLACGCKEGTEESPIYTTIFYPNSRIKSYHLFMTKSDIDDKNILSNYYQIPIELDSLYHGKLLRIDLPVPSNSGYAKVVGISSDSLFISDAIKVNSPLLSSTKAPSIIKINRSNNHTSFQWDKTQFKDNKVFLSLISNDSQNVRSCIYSKENYFKVDDLSHAERIMYPLDPSVSLDESSTFFWMAVNNDNWITHLAKISF